MSAPTDIGALLDDPSVPVHAIGAGGIGMAGLAYLLRALGHPVDGCDAAPGRTSRWLAARDIPVAAGHDPAHLARARWAIYSPACPPGHPELAAARAAGIPLHRRGHVLPVLAGRFERSVAVAGTHGKTTTSALLAHILLSAGVDASYCIGGELPPDLSPARLGASDAFVLEADESDGTLARYAPFAAVLTNVEPDHLDHFPSADALRDCFRTFVQRARHLVACADDPVARALAAERPQDTILYSAAETPLDPPPAGISLARILDAAPSPDGWSFAAELPTLQASLRATLPLPGRHNLANALAALAAAVCILRIAPQTAADALATFRLPMRRLEHHNLPDGRLLVADYAHHPTEIRAFVDAVRQLHPDRRLVAIFQPHRYSRTRQFADAFPDAFRHVAHVVLAPVYAASEPPLPGGASDDLLPRFAAHGIPATLSQNLPDALPLALAHMAAPSDILLLVGAGDIISLAP